MSQKVAAICEGCSYLIEFDIPDEEVGMAIRYECPRCSTIASTPGVTPEALAMSNLTIRRSYDEMLIEEGVDIQGIFDDITIEEPEPEPHKSFLRRLFGWKDQGDG